jgi:Carboxylesterase family
MHPVWRFIYRIRLNVRGLVHFFIFYNKRKCSLIPETSLLLDIWAPASATNTSALPVKVWVYGGADSSGGISNILYDGCQLGKDDALMVSIAYRLGPLGFLGLASAGFQGNQAIQDILMGLEWIQSNIASFGGDPVRVFFPHVEYIFHNFILSIDFLTDTGPNKHLEQSRFVRGVGWSQQRVRRCYTVTSAESHQRGCYRIWWW